MALEDQQQTDPGAQDVAAKFRKKPKPPAKEKPEEHNLIPDTGAAIIRPKLRNFFRPEGRYSTEKI